MIYKLRFSPLSKLMAFLFDIFLYVCVFYLKASISQVQTCLKYASCFCFVSFSYCSREISCGEKFRSHQIDMAELKHSASFVCAVQILDELKQLALSLYAVHMLARLK